MRLQLEFFTDDRLIDVVTLSEMKVDIKSKETVIIVDEYYHCLRNSKATCDVDGMFSGWFILKRASKVIFLVAN